MTSSIPPHTHNPSTWMIASLTAAAVIVLGAIFWPRGPSTKAPRPVTQLSLPAVNLPALNGQKPSVAVLSFAIDDRDQASLGNGIAEDLITDLAKVSGMVVIARPSSFAFKGRDLNPVQIGRELGARFVVSGKASKMWDGIRVAVNLDDVATGASIWTKHYEQNYGEMLGLLREIRLGVIDALGVSLTPSESVRLNRPTTNSVTAYESWLQGCERWNSVTRETHREAQDRFARSVEIDPGFARAMGRLARTYIYSIEQGWTESADRDVRRSVGLAQRAAELDPGQRDAGYVLSRVYLWHREHVKALAEMQRIVTMNPNFADGYVYIGEILIYAGRPRDAITYVDHATRINPQAPAAYPYVRGHAQYVMGQYREAAASLENALGRQPDSVSIRRMLVAAYGQLGWSDAAARELSQLRAFRSPISLRALRENMPYRDPLARERVLDGWRAAGVPE